MVLASCLLLEIAGCHGRALMDEGGSVGFGIAELIKDLVRMLSDLECDCPKDKGMRRATKSVGAKPKSVRIADVAKLAGCAPAAISRRNNNPQKVSSGVRAPSIGRSQSLLYGAD